MFYRIQGKARIKTVDNYSLKKNSNILENSADFAQFMVQKCDWQLLVDMRTQTKKKKSLNKIH